MTHENTINEIIQNFIYNDKLIGRKESFDFTLQEVYKRWKLCPINIVETGTTRKKAHEEVSWDGNSSSVWGKWVSLVRGQAWTCDISQENIEECKRWTKEWNNRITYVVDDSINFLSEFDAQIDLLYLDSFDTSGNDRNIIELACQHQLREINVIYNNLREDSLILLDDVRDDLKGGKSEYCIPFLINKGWKIINHDTKNQQVLLSK